MTGAYCSKCYGGSVGCTDCMRDYVPSDEEVERLINKMVGIQGVDPESVAIVREWATELLQSAHDAA